MALGVADVDAMLRSIGGRQLVRWKAYSRLEPWGFAAEERRWSEMMALMGSGMFVKGKFTPADFHWKHPAERAAEPPMDADRIADAVATHSDRVERLSMQRR